MILSGDFNVDFAKPLNDPNKSTTKYGTTINAVFFRYLLNFQSKVFISYFSYHKPIVLFLEYDTNDYESEPNLPE